MAEIAGTLKSWSWWLSDRETHRPLLQQSALFGTVIPHRTCPHLGQAFRRPGDEPCLPGADHTFYATSSINVGVGADTPSAAGKRYAVRQDLASGNPSTSGCAVIRELPLTDGRSNRFHGVTPVTVTSAVK